MTIPAHECVISALAQSPSTGMMASASHDKSVKIWKQKFLRSSRKKLKKEKQSSGLFLSLILCLVFTSISCLMGLFASKKAKRLMIKLQSLLYDPTLFGLSLCFLVVVVIQCLKVIQRDVSYIQSTKPLLFQGLYTKM